MDNRHEYQGRIKIRSKPKLNMLIQSYFFIEFTTDFDIKQNPILFQNIANSEIVVINKYQLNDENLFFIISFQNTIIIIKQSLLHSLAPLFESKSELKFYYFQDTKTIFNQQMQNSNFKIQTQIECDKSKNEEVYNFNEQLIAFHITNFEYPEMYPNIKMSISRYLIQDSYEKLNKEQIVDFSKDFSIKIEKEKEVKIEKWNNDDYIDLSVIGSGSSSAVKLVYQIEDRKLYAIKMQNISNDESDEYSTREYKNYMRISYPLLPKLYGVYKKGSIYYLKIQFINGKTLKNSKEFVHLSFENKIFIVLQLALIINYFHKKGFVYRDLKPNNIIIDENNTVFVIDFDRLISEIEDQDKTHTLQFGKYSAPEVNHGIISTKNDIYSLGMMINYLLNIAGKKDELEFRNIKSLENFCQLLIDEDPSKRPSIADILYDFCINLRAQINNLPIQQTPEIQYFQGLIHIQNDIASSIHYLVSSADQNYLEAQLLLGIICYDGKYITRDIDKSIHYFTLAANHNYFNENFLQEKNLDKNSKLWNCIQRFISGNLIQKSFSKTKIANIEFEDEHEVFIELKKLFFNDITEKCQSNINNEIIQNIYLKFSFMYYLFDLNSLNFFKPYLTSYLNECKFFTYEIIESSMSIPFFPKNKEIINSKNLIDVIICAEKECIIIRQIKKAFIQQILTETKAAFINTNLKTSDNECVKEEILNFTQHYKHLIDTNDFVKCTINPIVGYLIRRYFYPSNYFKDQSFFNFEKSSENSKESAIQTRLYDIINQTKEKEEMREKLQQFQEDLIETKNNCELNSKIYEFDSKDFHVLRTIHSNSNFSLTLVIHIKSLYIFLCKNILSQNSDEFKQEIEFDSNYSHRCLTRFYGFVKNQNKITGFVYEFMSNGSLVNYIDSSDNLFSFMTFVRIFEGIKYIHSKSLIHQSIEPSNILLDHDFLPYISNYKHVRHENEVDQNFRSQSLKYSSPEQFFNQEISASTDVYSLGALIYFLFEKKNMISLDSANEAYDLIRDEQLPEMSNVTSSIQFIYLSCVRYEPEERLALDDIEVELMNEINSIYYIEEYLKNEGANHKKIELIQYLNECILFQSKDTESFKIFMENIMNFDLFSLFLSLDDFSTVLLNLGNLYFEGKIVQQNFLTARNYFELSTELNNSEAYLLLGDIYLFGNGTDENFIIAKECYEKAAQLNNSKAYISLGFLYLNGQGVKKDFTKAFECFKSSAKLNDAFAFINIGILYVNGQGVEKDINKADEYFEKAIKLNDPQAMNYLGDYFSNGQFIEKDYEKAKKYFELAAKQGHPNALFMLGCFYLNGNSVQQDCSKAVYYFEQSAQHNFLNAVFQLGNMYSAGQGVDKDIIKAIKYFEMAGKLNCSDGYFFIGNIYRNGVDIQQNLEKSLEYYEKASKMGNSEALNSLGYYYLNGIIVKQDYQKAIEYYNLSAKMNNYRAHCNLGIVYMNALGVPQNYVEARKHFELAAEQNDALSQFNLGNIYLNGFGILQDVAKAKQYFELAAKQNHPDALFNLATIYYAGIGVSRDIPKAINYFKLSSQQDNQNACIILAFLYSNGEYVEKDLDKAREYFEKAGQLNDPNYLFYLGYKYYENKDYKNALHYFSLAAEKNYTGAFSQLGIMYLMGQGVPKDTDKAVEYFEQSANPISYFFLGIIYLNKEKTPENQSKSKEYFEKFFIFFKDFDLFKKQYMQNLSNQFKSFNNSSLNMQFQNEFNTMSTFFDQKTNKDYLYYMGYLYFQGFGVEKNYAKAKEYFELSDNYASASECLGHIYLFENNTKKAKKYYKIAAKYKNRNVYIMLACIYYDECKYKKAIEYIKLEAELNNSYAIIVLGLFYNQGLGVERNYSTAKHYYEMAAKMNNSHAFYYLGCLYFTGQGVDQNYSKAKEYFEIAASMENQFAIYSLGNLYFYGKGVERDFKKAKELFESIKDIFPQSFIALGIIYANGFDVVRDLPKAKFYFKLASKRNISNAFYNLGFLYFAEQYGEVNYSKAFKYFKKAADQNHFYALYMIGEMYLHGLGVEKNYQKAKYYFEFAAQFGNSFAYMKLSTFYLNGFGVEKDFEKAKCYLEIAAKRNDPLALHYLGYIYKCCEFDDANITKAVDYFKKCVSVSDDQFFLIFEKLDFIPFNYEINTFKYLSYNNLGLIYLTVFNKINDAFEFMKIPAFAEFPFSQNNLGLIYQFYLNEIDNAAHMYRRSSEHNFALAEFNLGFINEKENEIEKAFEHYEKASKYQNEKMIFHNKICADRKLTISTTFVICYTELKLTEFYFLKNDFVKAKEYFIKSLSKFIFADIYPFNFKLNKDEIEKSFSYIKDFIFNFPLFDFKEQKNLNLNKIRKLNELFFMQNTKNDETKNNELKNNETKNDELKNPNESKKMIKIDSFVKKEEKFKFSNENINNAFDANDSSYHSKQLIFEEPGELFDFVIQRDDIKSQFLKEINNTIQAMKEILYTPPYFILFGSININKCKLKQKESSNQIMKDIDESFYEGFGVKF